jgi:hypothetical protein
MSIPKKSNVFIVLASEVEKVWFALADLVNTGSSSKKRLQIPSDLCEQTEERELIYGAGSLAARSDAASSFLQIQASLDYLLSKKTFKFVSPKIKTPRLMCKNGCSTYKE